MIMKKMCIQASSSFVLLDPFHSLLLTKVLVCVCVCRSLFALSPISFFPSVYSACFVDRMFDCSMSAASMYSFSSLIALQLVCMHASYTQTRTMPRCPYFYSVLCCYFDLFFFYLPFTLLLSFNFFPLPSFLISFPSHITIAIVNPYLSQPQKFYQPIQLTNFPRLELKQLTTKKSHATMSKFQCRRQHGGNARCLSRRRSPTLQSTG